MDKYSEKSYNAENTSIGVIKLSLVSTNKKELSVVNHHQNIKKANSFADLRKQVSKSTPFQRSLIDMYKQGR